MKAPIHLLLMHDTTEKNFIQWFAFFVEKFQKRETL
jgi:hypothetical protein